MQLLIIIMVTSYIIFILLCFQIKDLKFREEEPNHPDSVCSYPCDHGEAMYLTAGYGNCCWTCVKCHEYEYLPTKYECKGCPFGSEPNGDKSACVMINYMYLRYDDAIAIGAMFFSALGIILTGYVTVVFIRYNNTPVVRASGRELSYVLLFGIFLCYSMTFILVLRPSEISCGVQKYGIGLCFSICYSAILTKTNRISRIFRAGKRTARRPKFISPKSQLVICGAIVAFQNVVGAMWILMRVPEPVAYFANRDDHQLVCKDAVGGNYMIGFTYPIILVIVCTIYAILTRKIPEAFNESKYIGFTMYTTCIIWLAFVPIYFSTAYDIKLRIATMCYTISLSATVSLVCMFTPKLYIILTHPEKNVRKSMASQVPRNYTKSSAQPCTQNSSTLLCQYSSIPQQPERNGEHIDVVDDVCKSCNVVVRDCIDSSDI